MKLVRLALPALLISSISPAASAQAPDLSRLLTATNHACVLNHPVTALLSMAYKIAEPDGSFLSFGLGGDLLRDSEGRTLVTVGMPSPGKKSTAKMTFVLDPVLQRNLVWSTESKFVTVTDAKFPPCTSTVPPTDLQSRDIPKDATLTALPDKTIDGHPASGFLITLPLPGATGDAAQIRTELWLSKELGIPLEMKFSGKAFGEMQMDFSDLRMVEPPAARFQIPEGYVVSTSETPEK